MSEYPGPESDPTFSAANRLPEYPPGGGPNNQAELNADTGFEAVMEHAKPYFEHLAEELRVPLQEGKYASILGDDVTGRIPALVFGGLADRMASDSERPRPAHLFYAGGSAGEGTVAQGVKLAIELEQGEPEIGPTGIRKIQLLDRTQRLEYRDQKLSEYIGKIKDTLGERTLLVTDNIWFGRTIDRIAKLLHENGVAFDIATLGTNGDPRAFIEPRAERPEFQGVTWFTGGDETRQGVLYSRDDKLEDNAMRQAIGTEKDWLQPVAKRYPDFDAAKVNQARDYLARFSDELYDTLAANN